ncbi:pirin family protein [Abyssalbus ytuae]|uniref:Pirin family protein n=1 Tax=Abyssalbus ytuae TaxID=2926907 RepID=A0A9E6ZRT4_9FLAO|nr:pirin family protein [Abyssalbus ytuae]UOB17658.1 pirin family protein [Abyssalbus ytuae]
MRTIKKIHTAQYRPIDNLITYSPLPTQTLKQIDPFIFLNHHGPQVYKPNNSGLPFGPHPHRGMETVTCIIDGDIAHKDSGGGNSVIEKGGVQWMTAGKGLIHAEVSSEKFKKEGGNIEILQLWINLPSHLKMVSPQYTGKQAGDIPNIPVQEGVNLQLIAGKWNNHQGAFQPLQDIFLSTVKFNKNTSFSVKVSKKRNIFLYIINGSLTINNTEAQKHHLIEFNNDDDEVLINTGEESLLIFGHAEPINEPMVARGPFVMNTMQEIQQAYADFQQGKMGLWN